MCKQPGARQRRGFGWVPKCHECHPLIQPQDVDWRQQRHWACNNHVHPSRHGTYDGVSFHPFETVFVKSSWHVADPYTAAYTRWVSEHVAGGAGTAGKFNYYMYRYAIRWAVGQLGGQATAAVTSRDGATRASCWLGISAGETPGPTQATALHSDMTLPMHSFNRLPNTPCSEVAQRPHPDLQAAYNVTPCASAYARDEDLAGFYY